MYHLLEYYEYHNKIHIDEFANLIAQNLGYDKTTFLTQGTMSLIYNLNNQLLKITTSKNEAITATKLNSVSNNFVKIYSVYGLNTKYKINDSRILRFDKVTDLYVIIMEKLIDLDRAENIMGIIYDCTEDLLPNTLLQQSASYRKKFIDKLLLLDDKYLLGNNIDDIIKCYDSIIKMNNDLKKVGINCHDAHMRNFGFNNNGDFVIFDIQDTKKITGKIPNILNI